MQHLYRYVTICNGTKIKNSINWDETEVSIGWSCRQQPLVGFYKTQSRWDKTSKVVNYAIKALWRPTIESPVVIESHVEIYHPLPRQLATFIKAISDQE